MKKICMVVQAPMVKGGISAVVNGYRGSLLEHDYKIIYVESYKDGNKIEKLLKAVCGYINFIKVLAADKPDLIHIHSSFGASFYRKIPFIFMASRAKLPIINHIHGADFDEFFINASKRKKALIKNVYSRCSMFITLSGEWKERLSQIVPDEKITVIENYGSVCEDAVKERLTRPCNNNVLFLGEIGRRKGCYDIPSVAKAVAKEIPDVKFVMCGCGSAEDEKAIKKLISSENIGKNFEFPGWVRNEEKDRALRNADIFFLPSYNEGMPMSILDAMGYGLPVVSTNVGGIPKIVHNGENGICCAAGDTEKFSEGIVKLLADTAARNSASKESVRILKDGYSLETHIDLLEKAYESV